ncbi:hypothetical protein F0562_004205 [Nyssa sinensis]|uniref:WEB family protein n=1 Tax=Nyssa sinensis TaxID=561372 RepID=A0A5J5BYR0_9ASTE|nr:hypothetical protein F0562_004205 [Nyssa sinensis]
MEQVGMDREEMGNRRRIGSVKAAMYGDQRIQEGNFPLKKTQMDFSEKHSSRTRELHLAKRDIGRFSESRRVAEYLKAQAESELFSDKKSVRDLASRIEESNSKVQPQMREMGKQEWALEVGNFENNQFAEVMRELECVKQELSKLKLDMASVLEEKKRSEKESEASSSKMWSYSSSVEALRKEIEEVNEERVLVELARIEALKEFGAIEAQRKEEANQHSSAMEETRKKMNDIIQEIDRAKELETKLTVTTSEVDVLQNELKLVKRMDRRVQRNGANFREGDKSDSPSLLQSVTEELEAAKKELASIREEGFQFMASIDIIRNELKHVSEETAQLKKTEAKADFTVQNLNSKLLRAKAKLEAASEAEEKTKAMVSNLYLALEQLKTEAGAGKKERGLINEETARMKVEVQKTESEIDLAEKRLQAALQELEAVKSSEEVALENLKTRVENTMRARASASQCSSTITISTFEHEYLTGRAVAAEKIADKKVTAAQAWIEALKASEREILMETELAQRKIKEPRMEEEQEIHRTERSLSAKIVVEGDLHNWRQKHEEKMEIEDFKLKAAMSRKPMNRSDNSMPARRAKLRNYASPAVQNLPRSTSRSIRRKRKVMPYLAKFFGRKKK